MSDFFEPPPRIEDEPETTPDWDGPPAAVVPATIPIERIVASNAEVAVYLASVTAYPTGFKFDVFVVSADNGSELDPFDFEHRMVAERTGEIPPGQLRLGFLFAGGSKATNTGKYFGWYDESGAPPDAPLMRGMGGVGGYGHQQQSFWVWPLPPPGKLEFLCEWPEAGIALTASELDSGAIIEAASRSQQAFPAKRLRSSRAARSDVPR
jgi:hypothetical protein